MSFQEALKNVTLFAHRIALGRLFQSFGAAHVNERSPRVVKLLNAGYFNKNVSELVLRLYLHSSLCTPAGYKLLDHPRTSRSGGGTGVLFRDKKYGWTTISLVIFVLSS